MVSSAQFAKAVFDAISRVELGYVRRTSGISAGEHVWVLNAGTIVANVEENQITIARVGW